MIIGIDQSLASTGIACLAPDGSIRLQTVESNPGQFEPRLLDIMRRINKCVGTAVGSPVFKPDLVVIEGISQGSFGATNTVLELAALHYLIRAQLFSQGIQFKIVSPSAVKKFAVGFGGSKKQAVGKEHVLKAVLQRWGIDTQSNDEADAAVLAYIGAAILGRIPATTAAQQQVVDHILAPAKKKARKMRNRAELG